MCSTGTVSCTSSRFSFWSDQEDPDQLWSGCLLYECKVILSSMEETQQTESSLSLSGRYKECEDQYE